MLGVHGREAAVRLVREEAGGRTREGDRHLRAPQLAPESVRGRRSMQRAMPSSPAAAATTRSTSTAAPVRRAAKRAAAASWSRTVKEPDRISRSGRKNRPRSASAGRRGAAYVTPMKRTVP
jgi:hypothetical protein